MKQKKLDTLMNEDWVNQPALLTYRYGEVPGSVLYGVRKPLASATVPLIPCSIPSKKRVYNEKPTDWFVGDDSTIKVRLYFLRGNKEKLNAIGEDTRLFKIRIRKK